MTGLIMTGLIRKLAILPIGSGLGVFRILLPGVLTLDRAPRWARWTVAEFPTS
jgi:hypothetical protein